MSAVRLIHSVLFVVAHAGPLLLSRLPCNACPTAAHAGLCACLPARPPAPPCRSKAASEFMEVVDASGAAFAVMPAGKGLLPESHPSFMGLYWGQVGRGANMWVGG